MALFQIDIEKRLNINNNDYYWTNVYHVDAASQAAAVTLIGQIVNIERTAHSTNITYTKGRARPMPAGTGPGSIVALSVNGTRTLAGEWLPMFNTLRVDFATAIGRPSRKYYRIQIGESDSGNGEFTAGFLTSMGTNLTAPLLAATYLRDVDGETFTAVTAIEAVQMRQLRRGSKRQVGPVI